jgi:Tfp pilus assembly protein PilF
MTIYRLTIAALAALLLIGGCSSNSAEPEPEYDVNARLSAAWGDFENEDYQSSTSIFQEVLDHQSSNAEAHMGLGWSHAFGGDLSSAASSFQSAISSGLSGFDAHMGLACVYRDLPNLQQALSYADQVVAGDPAYFFSKRNSIDYLDARLIKAQVYFRQGMNYYDELRTELDYLSSEKNLSALPEQGDMSDEEYETLLLNRLEELTALIEG